MSGVAHVLVGEFLDGAGVGGGVAHVDLGDTLEGSGVGGGRFDRVLLGTFLRAGAPGAHVFVGDFIEAGGVGTIGGPGAHVLVGESVDVRAFGGGVARQVLGDFIEGAGTGDRLWIGRAEVLVGEFLEGAGEGVAMRVGGADRLVGEFLDGGGVGGGVARLEARAWGEAYGAGVAMRTGRAERVLGTFLDAHGVGTSTFRRPGVAEVLVGEFLDGGTPNQGRAELVVGSSLMATGRGLSISLVGELFSSYGMNIDTGAFWEYSDAAIPAFEIGRFNDQVMALIPGTGVVTLGASTADGADLGMAMRFGELDFRSEHLKRNINMLVTWEGDDDLRVKTFHAGQAGESYLVPGRGYLGERTRRVKLVQGAQAKFLSYAIESDRGRVHLHHVDITIEPLERRIK